MMARDLAEVLLVFSIDADGCTLPVGKFTQEEIVGANQQLIVHFVKTIRAKCAENKDKKVKVVFKVGSNRQSVPVDIINSLHGQASPITSSFFPALIYLAQATHEACRQNNLSENYSIHVDPFLLADLWDGNEEEFISGKNFLYGIDHLTKPLHLYRPLFDQSKFGLLYAQAHRAAAQAEAGEKVTVDFVDDKDGILKRLRDFFRNYPSFLPDNVILRLFKYVYREEQPPACMEDGTITGTGKIDYHYQKTIPAILRVIGERCVKEEKDYRKKFLSELTPGKAVGIDIEWNILKLFTHLSENAVLALINARDRQLNKPTPPASSHRYYEIDIDGRTAAVFLVERDGSRVLSLPTTTARHQTVEAEVAAGAAPLQAEQAAEQQRQEEAKAAALAQAEAAPLRAEQAEAEQVADQQRQAEIAVSEPNLDWINQVEKKINDELAKEMKQFLHRRGLSHEKQLLSPAKERYNILKTLQEDISRIAAAARKNQQTAESWKDDYRLALSNAIKRTLSDKKLDKYNELQKIVIHLLNLIAILFGPIKYPLTGTFFYSTTGKPKQTIRRIGDFVEKQLPVAPDRGALMLIKR
jgi:hypothetical protein